MIQAGDLRCRIQLYELEEVRNVLGERTMEYRPGRKVWAQIVPTSGRSAPQAGEVEPMEVTHRVVVRSTALPELRNGLRFTFRGQWYEAVSYTHLGGADLDALSGAGSSGAGD